MSNTSKKTLSRKKPARKAVKRSGKADVALLLEDIARTLHAQQRAIEQLIALHTGAARGPNEPPVPLDTVGSIPHITLVPDRAA